MLVVFAFLAGAGAASASTYTLNLTADDVVHNVFPTGQEGFTLLTGPSRLADLADPSLSLPVQVGDEIIVNISLTTGPFTLPASGHYSDFNYFLTGSGFPAGPNSLDGTVTVFDGLSVVAQNSFNSSQPADGFSAVMFLNAPQGPITFDSLTGDFFVRQIGGSSDPSASATLNSVFFGAQISDRPAVPEPTTWTLLLAGFGLIGSALRYRRGLTSLGS